MNIATCVLVEKGFLKTMSVLSRNNCELHDYRTDQFRKRFTQGCI